MMKARVSRWGTSLAVRIPQPIAQGAHLRAGDLVEVVVTEYGLEIQRESSLAYTVSTCIRHHA